MQSMNRNKGALVLLDYQQRLLPALHGGARAVDEAPCSWRAWRGCWACR
jgi:hypothetical protein